MIHGRVILSPVLYDALHMKLLPTCINKCMVTIEAEYRLSEIQTVDN